MFSWHRKDRNEQPLKKSKIEEENVPSVCYTSL